MSARTEAETRSAVTDAVRANSGLLLAYFLRRVEDREDAADLLSETFAVVWRRGDRMPQPADEARMWMYGIASHVLSNGRRAQRRRDTLAGALREELSRAQPAADDARVHVRADVARAMSALKPADRELLRLVHWDGLTLAEAAAVLGLKASTARTRAERARARLATLLGPEYAGAPPVPAHLSPIAVGTGAQ